MSIQRPSARLQLAGSGGLTASLGGPGLTAPQAALRRLRVDLSVDEAHDRVEAWLWPGSVLADAEAGAALSVAIGDGDSPPEVLKAEVAGVDVTPWGLVMTAFAPSRKLSGTYVGRSYVDHTVGDIVRDLVTAGGIEAGEIEDGISLPVFHVDPRRSAWGTLHFLAGRTGHQISSTPDGAVSFTAIPGAAGGGGLLGAAAAVASAVGLAPAAELREGAELLDFRIGPRPEMSRPDVVSPSGGTGPKWYLLADEPDSGASAPVLVDVALRTREAADAATTASRAAISRALKSATAVVPGNSSLRAGSTVKVRGADFRILRVRHEFDAEQGYVSDLLLEGAG